MSDPVILAIVAASANTLVSIATLIVQVLTARRLDRIEQRAINSGKPEPKP